MLPKLWTINALSVELAIDRRTLAAKLDGLTPDETSQTGRGETRRYKLHRVIAHLYGGDAKESAKDRLARIQGDRALLDLEVRRGELMPVKDVAAGLDKVFDSFKARLLSLPSALAPRVVGIQETHTVNDVLEEAVVEALNELYRFTAGPAGSAADSEPGAEAAADADGVGVGGPLPDSVAGGVRGAGPVEDVSR